MNERLSEKDLLWWIEMFKSGKALRDKEPFAFERVAVIVLEMALESRASSPIWRPISEAPEDGTPIIVWVDDYKLGAVIVK